MKDIPEKRFERSKIKAFTIVDFLFGLQFIL